MNTWFNSLAKAIGFELIQHGRNRFAIGLVIAFIPFWLALVNTIITTAPIEFMYAPEQRHLSVVANDLTLITGAINAVTLIVGFMMFTATFRSGEFDQRLSLAGFPRSSLLLAKLIALGVIAGIVSAYAWGTMLVFSAPEQPWLLWVSLLECGLTYGGIGVVLGVAARTELVGMFLIIMISLVDVMVQNPVLNPSSDNDVLRLLPSYSSMQSAVAASFTGDVPWGYMALGPTWLGMFTLFGLATFYLRTRNHAQTAGESPTPARSATPAVVVLSAADDGTVTVRSTGGPVVLCSRLAGGSSPDPDDIPAQQTKRSAVPKRAPIDCSCP